MNRAQTDIFFEKALSGLFCSVFRIQHFVWLLIINQLSFVCM